MAAHNELGRWGEDLAIDYLERKGYMILERDWKSGHRDIDIIARTEDEVVFVEVKTRGRNSLLPPDELVDYKKKRNLKLAANHYIKYKRLNRSFRFDIVVVTGNMDALDVEVNHIENAFF